MFYAFHVLLFVGSFQYVPTLLVVSVALLGSLLVGVWAAVLRALGGTTQGAGIFAPLTVACAFVALEVLKRRREARAEPKWVVPLDSLGVTRGRTPQPMPAKALALAMLAREGYPVPQGVALTPEFCQRLLAASRQSQIGSDLWRALPQPARAELRAFLAACSGGQIVVRAAFVDPRKELGYPGIFPAVRDLSPDDPERIALAMLGVLRGAEAPIALEYRRRLGDTEPLQQGLLIQRQIDAELWCVARSRGLEGRTDVVELDYRRPRSRAKSITLDAFDCTPLLGDESLERVPDWMEQVVAMAVALDRRAGGPVQIDFARAGVQLYVLGWRRVPAAPRTAWVRGGALAESPRLPALVREQRGGAELHVGAFRSVLGRLGAAELSPTASEFLECNGALYVDAEALRRSIAALTDTALFGRSPALLFRLMVASPSSQPRAFPRGVDVSLEAWRKLRAIHAEQASLEATARVRLGLLGDALRVLGVAERDVHPAVRWVLGRRARESARDGQRLKLALEDFERALQDYLLRLMATAVAEWDAMFLSELVPHASVDEIERWLADASAREPLVAGWRRRKETYVRHSGPPRARIFEPPVADDPAVDGVRLSLRDGVQGRAVVAGKAVGRAVLINKAGQQVPHDATIVVPDGRAEFCPYAFGVRGLILLGGGMQSPLATLARELRVPTVLCNSSLASSWREGSPLRVDGDRGRVEFGT